MRWHTHVRRQVALEEMSKLVATVTADLDRERQLRQHDSMIVATWQSDRVALEEACAKLEREKVALEQRLQAGKTVLERQRAVRSVLPAWSPPRPPPCSPCPPPNALLLSPSSAMLTVPSPTQRPASLSAVPR